MPAIRRTSGSYYDRIFKKLISPRGPSKGHLFGCRYTGCTYKSTQRGNLKTHTKIHFGLKDIRCEHAFTTKDGCIVAPIVRCNFRTGDLASYIRHGNRIHPGQEKVADKRFDPDVSLDLDMTLVHELSRDCVSETFNCSELSDTQASFAESSHPETVYSHPCHTPPPEYSSIPGSPALSSFSFEGLPHAFASTSSRAEVLPFPLMDSTPSFGRLYNNSGASGLFSRSSMANMFAISSLHPPSNVSFVPSPAKNMRTNKVLSPVERTSFNNMFLLVPGSMPTPNEWDAFSMLGYPTVPCSGLIPTAASTLSTYFHSSLGENSSYSLFSQSNVFWSLDTPFSF
ncbi:unnamed protein product [Somion occarium]|uniref:C2H2-type domain-containing protein n=1 Tax=Somion occarium TaxID=3059160 RepID=A0ABP1ED49_9APHY